MISLKNVFNNLFSRRNKLEQKEDGNKNFQYSNFRTEKIDDSNNDFEKNFTEYETFIITQSNVDYHISTMFTDKIPNETKMLITNFIKDGFNNNIDPLTIIFNVQIAFSLNVARKGIPEEKKLKILIGNINI